jgi:hypothetical protein
VTDGSRATNAVIGRPSQLPWLEVLDVDVPVDAVDVAAFAVVGVVAGVVAAVTADAALDVAPSDVAPVDVAPVDVTPEDPLVATVAATCDVVWAVVAR